MHEPKSGSFQFASLGPRIRASAIDFLVFLPLWVLLSLGEPHSQALSASSQFLALFLVAGYNVYGVGRWGMTLGKKAIGIQVRRNDGGLPDYNIALRRYAVMFVLNLGQSIAAVAALRSLPLPRHGTPALEDTTGMLGARTWSGESFFGWLVLLWITGRIFSILLHKKHRALHDFVADTVVLRMATQTAPRLAQPDPAGSQVYVSSLRAVRLALGPLATLLQSFLS